MSLALRVAASIAVACVAASLALVFVAEQAQREALGERVAETVRARMESGGRERCEAAPARFEQVSGVPVQRAGRRARRRAAIAPRETIHVYASDGTSETGAAALDASVLDALDDEDETTVALRGRGAEVVVRMPWDEGPCAIVAVEVPRPDAPGRLRALVLGVVVAAVAALAAFVALRSPLSRLRTLTRASDELARTGFRDAPAAPALPPPASDEVGELTRAFRAALERIREDGGRLAARDVALSEYVAHTTHDLATPLTAITSHLAELEQDLAAGRAVDRVVVERATSEAHYLAQLVANLGVVARLDRPDPIVQKRPLDLREVVERVATRHEPLARAAGLVLDHAVPELAVPFEGDDLLLERAIGNLVHNAIRHRRGQAGGHVALVLARGEPGPTIRVLDDGAPVDAATLARLRDPTPDAARTRAHGFGLDVVRRVAALHGLALAFDHAEGGGLEVTLAPAA